jgi:2'-5' RNA ligase
MSRAYLLDHTAGHTFVPQDHSGTGIMACFAPPKHVTDHLSMNDENAEPEHDLHVTLSYLGKTGDYSLRQLADLPEVMDSWAEGHRPVKLAVQGSGTFLAPDQDSPHVLHALVNAPGLHRMQAHLVDHLKHYGFQPRENHGYIPHITLGYTRHDVRFLPKVQRKEWTARSVWTAIGDRRQEHRFGG